MLMNRFAFSGLLFHLDYLVSIRFGRVVGLDNFDKRIPANLDDDRPLH